MSSFAEPMFEKGWQTWNGKHWNQCMLLVRLGYDSKLHEGIFNKPLSTSMVNLGKVFL